MKYVSPAYEQQLSDLSEHLMEDRKAKIAPEIGPFLVPQTEGYIRPLGILLPVIE